MLLSLQQFLSNIQQLQIISQGAMNEEASMKNQKFTIEIRRRQRQEIMKKQRQLCLAEERKQLVKKNTAKPQETPPLIINCKTIQQLYGVFLKSNNFMSELRPEDVGTVMKMILVPHHLEIPEVLSMLGTTILFFGSISPNTELKKSYVRKALTEANIEQTIFELLIKNMNLMQNKLVRMYLGIIKNMALVRFEKLTDKNMLQKYLRPILDNFITESSVIVFLAYISEFHVLAPDIMKNICDQACSKQKIMRVLIVTILTNYTTLESSEQNILKLFEQILQTLIHLYIQCKPYEVKYAQSNLHSILRLISKFPENMGKELLSKVEKTKLQDTLIVVLTVSNEKTKEIVYEIEEAIIDKCIHELGPEFFSLFSKQVIQLILSGIEYSNITIIERCLKTMTKLFYYAQPEYIKKLGADHELAYVLEDLSYHKNQFISQTAIELRKYLPEDDLYGGDDMNDF